MHDCLRAMGPQAPTVAKFVPFLKVGAAPKGFMGRNTKMLETDWSDIENIWPSMSPQARRAQHP